MTKVTVHLDEVTLAKIRRRAAKRGISMSEWVRLRIIEEINGWPPGYFDLCGVLKDVDISRPKQTLCE